MKKKKQIINELKAILKKEFTFFREQLDKSGEKVGPLVALMRNIIYDYKERYRLHEKKMMALEAEVEKLKVGLQTVGDIAMRFDTVANKLQAALTEHARINEMLIKRVEEVEKYVEAQTSIQYTGDDIRSGVLNVCGGANDHYSDTVTAKPTDNATFTWVKVNAIDPKSVQEAVANGFGSEEPPNETT